MTSGHISAVEKTHASDREGFTARVNALRMAVDSLPHEPDSAISMIRRICRSLDVSTHSEHTPEIASIMQTLSKITDEKLGETLIAILPRLSALATNLQARHHNILIVEDDPIVQKILQNCLRAPNRQLFISGTLSEAERHLVENEISMVLLDLQLPDGDGREFLLKLRERPSTATIPVLVISSEEGSSVQTECYALGADTFFEKPFDAVTLSTAVATKLQSLTEATRRSSSDPLTGLPNRRAFNHAFIRAVMLASRSQEPLAIAMIDVDRFKSVNDIYGHLMGDRVLRRLASVLRKSLRATDFLARWGGEEFAVFFPSTDITEAGSALTKALKIFREEMFETSDDGHFQVTFSGGVASVKSGATIEEAVATADRYLYMAKASGRDRIATENDDVSAFQKSILLVEDDDLTASLIKNYLSRDGYKVIHAKNGESALEAAANHSISLITLDVKIPDLDGFELLKRFRKTTALHQVPIVMLTSSSKQEDVVRGFQLGADDYILKPFSPRELLARVQRFLQK